MSDLLLLGGGGYALSLLDILEESNINILGFHAKTKNTLTNLAFVSDVEALIKSNPEVRLVNAVGIASGISRRAKVFENFQEEIGIFASVISRYAYISTYAKISAGVHIFHDAVIERGVSLDMNVVIGSSSSIHHGTEIGKHSFVGPGARVLGECQVGTHSVIGSNAVIAPGIIVGNHCKVTAGSFLRSNLSDGAKNY